MGPMPRGADVKVAAAAGLSVYLPLYWLSTRPDSDGAPNPLTAGEVAALLLVLTTYLLAPFARRLLSRRPLASKTPSWLSTPALSAALLVGAALVFGGAGLDLTAGEAFAGWLMLSVWAMPAAAAVYYFGAAARSIKARRGACRDAGLGLRE